MGGYGVYFSSRLECNVSEFVPTNEVLAIGRAQLHTDTLTLDILSMGVMGGQQNGAVLNGARREA